MSIINNVLRDLEQRSSQFTPVGVTSAGGVVDSKPRYFMPALLSFLLLLVCVFGFWLYQQGKPGTDLLEVISFSNVDPVVATPAIESPVTGEALPLISDARSVNQLIGMQFRESNDAISLAFSLREKVVSYLKARSEYGFIYHLKDIDSEIIAPVISDNRWIERLTITPQAGGLDIGISTLAGVLIETQQQQIGGEQVWEITLTKIPDPVEIAPLHIAQNSQTFIASGKNSELVQMNVPASDKVENLSDTGQEATVDKKVVKLEIKSRSTGSDAVEQLKAARTLVQQRQYKEAEAKLLELLGGSQDLVARETLLVVYKRNKQSARHNVLTYESMKRYPQHAVFATVNAQSLFQQGAYQRVIEFLQGQQNQNAVQLALIGASYQRLDQHSAAANFYRQSLKIDSSQSRNWIALGLAEEHNANLPQALAAYRTAKNQGNLNSRLIEFVDKRSKILEKVIN